MGATTGNLEEVAALIHLAVAPVFLLTAVATTLVLLAGRLARIVDRGRSIETLAAAGNAHYREELLLLERRARLIYLAMKLGVTAAILVCFLMSLAFLGKLLAFNAARAVAMLFMAGLFSYTGSLIFLLREMFLALGSFSLGIHAVADAPHGAGKTSGP